MGQGKTFCFILSVEWIRLSQRDAAGISEGEATELGNAADAGIRQQDSTLQMRLVRRMEAQEGASSPDSRSRILNALTMKRPLGSRDAKQAAGGRSRELWERCGLQHGACESAPGSWERLPGWSPWQEAGGNQAGAVIWGPGRRGALVGRAASSSETPCTQVTAVC